MASKFATPTKTPRGRTDGVVRANRWGALAVDSDSDSDRSPSPVLDPRPACPGAPRKAGRAAFLEPLPSPAPAPAPAADPAVALPSFWATDPIMQAMERGDILWGDLIVDAEPAAPAPAPVVRRVSSDQERCDAWLRHCDVEEAELWEQPFARDLEMYWSDCYDTRPLSDADYAAFMTWIHAHGWTVEYADRAGCKAVPDNEGVPTRWVPPSRFTEEAAPCCGGGHSHGALAAPGTDVGRRKGAPVPHFCRAAGECKEEGCRYVHGDTIPRVNKPCGFGEACGASDPTGVKRSQCRYMHPGEEWSADLVIRRRPS